MIVIDASLAFELSIATKQGESLGARLASESKPLIAPEVIELEFLQTLRRYLWRGKIDRDRAAHALRNFADMEIERCAHAPLRARVWDLRENLTA